MLEERKMKVAVSLSGRSMDGPFDARFGRAAFFGLTDMDTGEQEVLENPAVGASSGAGVQAAQSVVDRGVQVVVSGAFGPKAHAVLASAGVVMYVAPSDRPLTGTEVLKLYREQGLERVTAPTHAGHHDHPARAAERGRR